MAIKEPVSLPRSQSDFMTQSRFNPDVYTRKHLFARVNILNLKEFT